MRLRGLISSIFNKRQKITIFIWVLCSSPSFYYAYKHIKENQIVDKYIQDHGLENAPANRDMAIKVSRLVISEFNSDEKNFKHLKLDDRPFLREDAGTLLLWKEGLCGEGARVIIRILNRMGFDATRVTLYDQFLQTAHTLVSVKCKDQDPFWVNSINSPDSITILLENAHVSSANYNYLSYSENLLDRRKKIQDFEKNSNNPSFQALYNKYLLYSFEAIPLTKLLKKAGFNIRTFNLSRPPRFISVIAEEPFKLLSILYLILSFLISPVLSFIFHRFTIRDSKRQNNY